MKSRTYYEILGVSRDASIEEITIAKNALAKVYHPDANAHKDIDTTAFMQEILEAYQTLSDPEKRKGYDVQLFGNPEPVERVFKTFKLEPEEKTAESVSFVTYWNAYSSLNEILEKSLQLMNREEKKKSMPKRLLGKLGRAEHENTYRNRQIAKMAREAVQYITLLKMAEIPMEFWNDEAMNWVLVRWGQKPGNDYIALFNRYRVQIERMKSASEKKKLHSKNRQFHHDLKKLLSYALEG